MEGEGGGEERGREVARERGEAERFTTIMTTPSVTVQNQNVCVCVNV